MKVLTILFTFLAFTIIKGMILESGSETSTFTFPTLNVPTFEFRDLSGGCGSFTDCIEYVGAVIYNIGLAIIFLALLFVNIMAYVFLLFSLLVQVSFTGIDDAPGWLNALLTTPFFGALGFIIYRLIRKGDSED